MDNTSEKKKKRLEAVFNNKSLLLRLIIKIKRFGLLKSVKWWHVLYNKYMFVIGTKYKAK